VFAQRLGWTIVQDPAKWGNTDLGAYLEALAAWVGDMDGWFRNRGVEEPEQPTWAHVAQILLASALYE